MKKIFILTVVFIFGGISAGMGIFQIIRIKKRSRCYTAKTSGTVSEIRRIVTRSADTDSNGDTVETTRSMYYHLFAYSVDGVEYRRRSRAGSAKPKFSKGAEVTVFYNPNKPDDCYINEEFKKDNIGAAFTVFGAVLMAAAFVLFLILLGGKLP